MVYYSVRVRYMGSVPGIHWAGTSSIGQNPLNIEQWPLYIGQIISFIGHVKLSIGHISSYIGQITLYIGQVLSVIGHVKLYIERILSDICPIYRRFWQLLRFHSTRCHDLVLRVR